MLMERSLYSFNNLQKIKKTRLKFSQGNLKYLEIMENYQEVKATNTQLNKLKSAAKK